MTAPGGASGEDARDGAANPPEFGGWAQTEPPWEVPGASPGPPPPISYPPIDYPPPPYEPPGAPFGYPPPPGYGYGGPPPGYGYGPPLYPGGYYPAPDYRGAYGPQAAAQSGTNGMAIASLISSFTGLLCCIGGIVGIVLGIIALDQIKRTRQDGYAIAVAGIVIGIATLIVALIVGIFAMHSS
jgi:Domain of unknown function (DUF4190)